MIFNRNPVQPLMLILLLLIVSLIPIHAQNAAVLLGVDVPVTGTLSADNVADVYTFAGSAGSSITLTAQGDGASILLTGLDGSTLGEAGDDGSGTAIIDAVDLPASGQYFVTVFGAAGDYTLVLAGVDQNAASGDIVTEWNLPGDVLVNNGMEVRLRWDADVDLNLEVRDPRGNTLYYDSRTTPVGGTFGFDANGFCEIISDAPAESATWQPGFLPGGSYEVLVFYRQSCTTALPPVSFTLSVTVNGQALDPVQGVVQPPATPSSDSVYLASFEVASDGTGTMHAGGEYPDSAINQLAISAADLAARAVPIARDAAVKGAIFEAQDFVTYSFEAQAEEVVSVSMTATSGNLDTLLQLVDPNGNLIAVNDDANLTNSVLNNVRIIQSGTYTIVATRYGKGLGGTEGEFDLVVSETSAALPPNLSNLNLPPGDIEVFLTWGTNADLQLLVRDPVGQSVYDDSPQVNSGGILAASGNVNCEASDGSPVSYIYWPLGLLRPGIYETEVWFQNTCQDTRIVEFTLTVVINDRVIAVERQIPAIGDRFVLTFSVNSDGSAQAEVGGFTSAGTSALDFAAEAPLTIQFNQPINGSITLENDFDVYAFQGEANQIVTIFMEATSQTLDTNLYLLDNNGIVIAGNDDADSAQIIGNQQRPTDSLISSFTLPSDGIYRVVATRFGTAFGGTVGTYRLTLQGS